MCGRYSLWELTRIEDLIDRSSKAYKLEPRYNAAPGQTLPVVTAEGLHPMKWGLVPSWAKDPNIGYRMVNARAEGIEKKTGIRASLKIPPLSGPGKRFL